MRDQRRFGRWRVVVGDDEGRAACLAVDIDGDYLRIDDTFS